jgi:hypothetical protein
MPAPYTGRCLCGSIGFRVTEEPLTVYACHCTDCQKRSGSAFSLSVWVNYRAIEVTKGEPVQHESATEDGRVRNLRICPRCISHLWAEPRPGSHIAVVRGGTLDDADGLRPIAHLWTRSAQPWFPFPDEATKYETQPNNLLELVALWRDRPQ